MWMYHDEAYFDKTPIEKQRVCCNCRHRGKSSTDRCEIDGHYIGYISCFSAWCRHWASDEDRWKEGKNK